MAYNRSLGNGGGEAERMVPSESMETKSARKTNRRDEFITPANIAPYISTIVPVWTDGDETSGSLSGNYCLFRGKRYDVESSLYRVGERQYSGSLGRAISRGLAGGANAYSVFLMQIPAPIMGITETSQGATICNDDGSMSWDADAKTVEVALCALLHEYKHVQYQSACCALRGKYRKNKTEQQLRFVDHCYENWRKTTEPYTECEAVKYQELCLDDYWEELNCDCREKIKKEDLKTCVEIMFERAATIERYKEKFGCAKDNGRQSLNKKCPLADKNWKKACEKYLGIPYPE